MKFGVRLARANYVTNANIDDRFAHDCYQKHADALDENPNVDLIYSDQYRSDISNLTFSQAEGREELRISHAQFSKGAMSECLPNNHPMWRKDFMKNMVISMKHLNPLPIGRCGFVLFGRGQSLKK